MSVYLWGSNKCKQLIGQSGLHSYSPAAVVDPLLEDAIPCQVAAGDVHTLILTEAGNVYSYGGGKDGQLGNGRKVLSSQSGCKVEGLDHETIVHIAAGSHSSFAVTATGKVYHW